jgi:hypothetical protein
MKGHWKVKFNVKVKFNGNVKCNLKTMCNSTTGNGKRRSVVDCAFSFARFSCSTLLLVFRQVCNGDVTNPYPNSSSLSIPTYFRLSGTCLQISAVSTYVTGA